MGCPVNAVASLWQLVQLQEGDEVVLEGYTVSKAKVADNKYQLPIYHLSRGGVTKTLRDIARETGIPFSTLLARVNRRVSYAELFGPKRGSLEWVAAFPDPFPVPLASEVSVPSVEAGETERCGEVIESIPGIPERIEKAIGACHFSGKTLFLCGAGKVFPALLRAPESGVELYYCRNGHSKRQGVTA